MRRIKLGDIIEIKQGFAFKTENYVEKSEYALVTLANITEDNNFQFRPTKTSYYGAEFPKDVILSEGDLIMPMTEQVIGLFGNSAFVPKIAGITFVLNQRVGKVIIKDNNVDKLYLHYLLSTKLVRDQLENHASGTKQRNISPSDIYDVTVFIPDKERQIKIGKILYNIEKKINNNNTIIELLEEYRKTIFDYYFFQFDFPNKEGKPYSSSGGKMRWDDKLRRNIPEDWITYKFLDLIKWDGGSQPPKSTFKYEYQDGYVRFIQNRDYSDNNHITYIKESKSNKLCDADDIMMDKYGDAGKTRYGLKGAYNVALSKIEPKMKNTKEFIRSYLSSDAMYNYLHKSCMASTRASLNEENFAHLYICLPSDSLLEKYENETKKIVNLVLKTLEENNNLNNLKDFYLPLLMNEEVI